MRAYKALGSEWFGRAVVDRMFIVTTIKLSVSLLYLGATIKPTVTKTNTVESCISEALKGESWCRV